MTPLLLSAIIEKKRKKQKKSVYICGINGGMMSGMFMQSLKSALCFIDPPAPHCVEDALPPLLKIAMPTSEVLVLYRKLRLKIH